MAVAVAEMTDQGERPALRAWRAAHERERKRMAIKTQHDYALWIGVDPGQWSKWCSGRMPVPGPQGRRLALLLDHEPRLPDLWLRLSQEQERRALLEEAAARAAPGQEAVPDG